MRDKLKQFFRLDERTKTILLWVLLSIAFVSATVDFGGKLWMKYHSGKFNVYEEQLTLKYQGAKCALVDEAQRYIDSVAPNSCLRAIVVVDKCIEYDIDVCFVLAQGQKESHFGTQGLARKTNSVWNVFAFDGQAYDEIHKNGKYRTPDDSVEPYMLLLRNNYLKNKTEYDLLDKFVNATGQRYASDKNYEAALTSIYTRIKQETRIDYYSQQLKKYDMLLKD